MTIYEEISSAVQRGKRKEVAPLVQQAIDEGCSAEDILNQALIPAMDVIGEKFSQGEVFVPEMPVTTLEAISGERDAAGMCFFPWKIRSE